LEEDRGLKAPRPPTVEHVGVDHGGLHTLAAQQLLNGPDVVAVLQKMGRDAVPQGVDGRRFGQARLAYRHLEDSLGVAMVAQACGARHPDDCTLSRLKGACSRATRSFSRRP
jgi:hypothetical protein